MTKTFESVRKELMIKTSPARAFKVFTEQFHHWWPKSHHIGKAEMKEAILEGRAGGRWYEIGVDGSECDWGKILVWEPPKRLILGWQINAEWKYDEDLMTEVELNFVEVGPHLTRVTLEHRDIDKFGISAQDVWNSLDSERGWTGLLRAFSQLADRN
jgi:uncharacterized protein YndB with AHSA1/START domain